MGNNRENYKARIRIKKNEQTHAFRSGGTTLALRSMGEVAEILGCSRQAVHQVERTAIHKIRLAMANSLREENPALAAELDAMTGVKA